MGFLGEFFSGSEKTWGGGNTSQTPNTPQWYKDMLESNMTRANTVANRSADQAIAGFNTDQTNSFDMIRQMLGQGQGNFDQANQTLSGLLNSDTSTDYQKYMNPYINDVIQQQKNEAVRDADKQRLQLQSQQQNAGSWGGSRSGVALGELNRNLDTQLNSITSTGLNNAYNQAQNLSMLNRNQQLSAANQSVNAALQNQSYALNDANALNKVGTSQQQLEQARLDLPQAQTSWLSGLLGNIKNADVYGSTGTSTQFAKSPTAGWGKDLVGIGATLAGYGGYSEGGLVDVPRLSLFEQALAQSQDDKSNKESSFVEALGGLGKKIMNQPKMNTGSSNPTSTGNKQMGDIFKQAGLPSTGNTPEAGLPTLIATVSKFLPMLGLAEGGQVQGYADGGLLKGLYNVGNLFSDHIMPDVSDSVKNSATYDLLVNRIIKGKNVEDSTYVPDTRLGDIGKFYTDMVDTVASMPSMAVQATGALGKMGVDYLTRSKKAEQAALKAQQERQKVSQQTGKTVPAGQGEPASGDEDFLSQLDKYTESLPKQDPVSSVIEETKQAASDQPNSISDLIKYMREQNTPKQEEKSKMNLPLLMAGLGIMASKNHSFMGAIGEGGLTGAQEYAKEQAAAKEREALHQKALNEMLVNLQKNQAKQENDATRTAIYKDAVDVQKQQAALKANVNKTLDARIKTLQAQVNNATKLLQTATLPADKEKYQKAAQLAQTQIDQLLMSASNSSNQPFGSGTMLQPPVDEQDSGDTSVKEVSFDTMK